MLQLRISRLVKNVFDQSDTYLLWCEIVDDTGRCIVLIRQSEDSRDT